MFMSICLIKIVKHIILQFAYYNYLTYVISGKVLEKNNNNVLNN